MIAAQMPSAAYSGPSRILRTGKRRPEQAEKLGGRRLFEFAAKHIIYDSDLILAGHLAKRLAAPDSAL